MRQTTLVASERRNHFVEKATFFVSNVGENCTVNDIRGHCSDMRVKVLFCFEVTRADGVARCFKLAVPATASEVIMNAESWPRRVFVRPWNSQRAERGGEEGEDELGYSVFGGEARGESSLVGTGHQGDSQGEGGHGVIIVEGSEQERPSLQSQEAPIGVETLKGNESGSAKGAVSTQAVCDLVNVASNGGALDTPTTLQARPEGISHNPADLTVQLDKSSSVGVAIVDSPAIGNTPAQLNSPALSAIRSSLN
jgi:hypothetical protein